jgi:hypothetical protein
MIPCQSLALGPPAISLSGSGPRREHPGGLAPDAAARQPGNRQGCHPGQTARSLS